MFVRSVVIEHHMDNPFSFMELQDVQEPTNFFECRVSSYQVDPTLAASKAEQHSKLNTPVIRSIAE
jgi:hypothetical protein